MFHFAKALEAVGIAVVGWALFFGIARDDMWNELYMSLAGLVLFATGRLLEPRS